MTVCAKRAETPGFFTSCAAALGGCRCGEQVAAELLANELEETA